MNKVYVINLHISLKLQIVLNFLLLVIHEPIILQMAMPMNFASLEFTLEKISNFKISILSVFSLLTNFKCMTFLYK